MAEWLKAPVLKTGMEQSIVGSNPSPSALILPDNACRLIWRAWAAVYPVSQYRSFPGEVPEWLNGTAC